jgi:hypothetical protein
MLVGPRRVLLMDEISTGLDSATLFSTIQVRRRRQRRWGAPAAGGHLRHGVRLPGGAGRAGAPGGRGRARLPLMLPQVLGTTTRALDLTTVISLLQPPPEVRPGRAATHATACTIALGAVPCAPRAPDCPCDPCHHPRPWQVFDLFDDLLLMSEAGTVLYHGPAASAVAFFDTLGFRCCSL